MMELETELVVVHASAIKDRQACIDASIKLGFLTGDETSAMMKAHSDSAFIIGEPFHTDEPFDFATQDMTHRVRKIIPTMVKYRLTPPPEESYSLHRKLAGAFLLCTKMKAKIPCRQMFFDVFDNYKFEENE
eukprot:TRINITY_DN5936_c0_g1_i3.p2 TRINITY_DN5936_c0_g1~~TRINITY_DN5936_c0_g1_i3.p2  ORF type:complete len:132 (+),score=40.99 TRINITY_DN5936_c0_g1_i3:33-428(+)